MPLQEKVFPLGPLQANCIVVYDSASHEGVIIDPGHEGPSVVNFVKSNKIKITAILLTHAHFDHCYGAFSMKRALETEIHVHFADTPIMRQNPDFSSIFGILPPSDYVVAPDKTFKDGDEFTVGTHTMRVIHTPGHSPGSCCFHFADDDLLISGDTIFRAGVGRTDLPGGSIADLRKSLSMLKERIAPTCRIVSGHGPETVASNESFHIW
eukprot:gnl/Chilomastix_cuspidata/1570.p1 GENE.gnl/Chilomastix_cuspidata/1570~~gnl/Chilomastix_cuspidata/1570.p1  ORF type:complete len:210 (-),score=80.13 gnl/Chilomastix_cuspidata/1570:408-1037(-)